MSRLSLLSVLAIAFFLISADVFAGVGSRKVSYVGGTVPNLREPSRDFQHPALSRPVGRRLAVPIAGRWIGTIGQE